MLSDNHPLLRALTLNAVFSGFSALLMLVAGGWLAAQFRLPNAIPIYAIGGFLALFALQLANIVRTKNIRTWEIKSIISGDIAWVIASVAIIILYYQSVTKTALILVDIAAAGVLFFAIQQIRGLREFRRTGRPPGATPKTTKPD